MYSRRKKQLDKPFQTYDQQIDILKYRGLIIKDIKTAKMLLSNYSYYDLVNGYKECFMVDQVTFKDNVRIEDLYEFHLLDKSVQNILFLYSTYVENAFKTALAYVIAKNISEDEFIYTNIKYYSTSNYTRTKNALSSLSRLCDYDRIEKIDNPTKYYLGHHNHVPPWILFKNATFSTCIDLASSLRSLDKTELITSFLKLNLDRDYLVDFFFDALATIRKFRNTIAHNLKFITYRMPAQQKISFRRSLPEFGGTILFHDRDGGKRCNGDPFSMLISLVALIQDYNLLESFFADLGQQMANFKNINTFSVYCSTTGIPEDILTRGNNYLEQRR